MKKITCFLLSMILIFTILSTDALARNRVMSTVSEDTLKLNNEIVYCQGFNVKGTNYYKLRDIAKILSNTSSRFNVDWNNNQIQIIGGGEYEETEGLEEYYYDGSQRYYGNLEELEISVDGKIKNIEVYSIDGNNYFKLRDLKDIALFELDWDNEKREISIFPYLPKNAFRVNTGNSLNRDNNLNIDFQRWKDQLSSYILDNGNGTISILETNQTSNNFQDNIVTIDTYNKDNSLIGSKSIPFELDLFGGFFQGEKNNYIVFGQNNIEEDNWKEVIRIVKYDKEFNRISSASIKGGECFTTKPFHAGSGRMDEFEDRLILHTSRERYTTEDGLNHQSQLSIILDTRTMKTLNYMGRFQDNHVSHSFDQYILFDNGSPIYIDHGDGYPRSVALSYGELNGNARKNKKHNPVDLFKIPGKVGANATGISIGGFEISNKNHIVAMNTVDHSQVTKYTSYELVGLDYDQRDILLSVNPRGNTDNFNVKHITVGNYIGTEKNASIPQLVKISDNKLMILWQEYSKDNKQMNLKYGLIDGEGNLLGEVKEIKDFVLSECKPIVFENNIVWYTNKQGGRIIYKIIL